MDQAFEKTTALRAVSNKKTKNYEMKEIGSYVDEDDKGRKGISKRQMYICDSAFNLQDSKMEDVMIQ